MPCRGVSAFTTLSIQLLYVKEDEKSRLSEEGERENGNPSRGGKGANGRKEGFFLARRINACRTVHGLR